jgi:tetratricopeptide (TPR) repeat protein
MSADLQQTLDEAYRLHKAGNLYDAERLYRDVVKAEPRHSDALHLLGVLELQSGRPHEAVAHIEQAIAVAEQPAVEFYTNVAAGHRALGNLDRALHHLKAAATLKPADATVHFRAGLIAMELGAFEDAVAYFGNTTALKPDFAEAHANLGNALKQLGRSEDALKSLRKAASLQPHDAGTHYALGVVLKDTGRIQDAIAAFATAVSLNAEHAGAQWNLALGHLLLGDYAEGWKTFDWYTRIKGASVRTYAQPEWTGGDLTGKTILLYEEHGYGDTLQFVRYARELKRRAGRVLVSCRPEMVRLLTSAAGVDAVDAADMPPPFDCHASFFALPKLMGTLATSIPGDVPYLFPQADLVAAWQARDVLKPGRNAGIVWRGNKTTDARRAMTPEQVAKICAVAGFIWVSL